MSVTVPIVPNIEKMRSPAFPQFVCEWHPVTGKVYLICLPGTFVEGEWTPAIAAVEAKAMILAEHCDSHARAYGFFQTYLRGYRQGMQDYPLRQKPENKTRVQA